MAYTDTPNMPLHMPTPGTKEPAQISLLNENCVVLSNHDHTTGKGLAMGRLRSGLAANRPAAGQAGNVYFSTDTGTFNVDTGTAWVQFLTSGGQATVTGWTLIDPIIRDTLQFGPEGSGTIDANITRLAAGALRVDNNVAVGAAATVPADLNTTWPSVRLGQSGVLSGTITNQVHIASNTYQAVPGWRGVVASVAGTMISLTPTSAQIATVPAVAEGVNQVPVARLGVAAVGTVSTYADAGQRGLVVNTPGGGNSPMEILIDKVGNSAPAFLAHPARVGMQFSSLGMIQADLGGDGMRFGSNYYQAPDGTYKAIKGGVAASMLYLTAGQMSFNQDTYISASPGGDNEQIDWHNRLSVDGTGNVLCNAGISSAAGDNKTLILYCYGPTLGAIGTAGLVIADVANSWRGYLTMLYPNAEIVLQSAHGPVSVRAATDTYFYTQSSGYVRAAIDNYTNLGHASYRWGTIYSSVGSINTSHVSLKQGFAPLDPAACVEAVLGTDWLSFEYKPPPEAPAPPEPLPPFEGETEEQATEREAHNAKTLEDYETGQASAAMSRQQKGYVLGSDEYTTSDLFGMADRYSASTHADLAVVACALQDALRRLAALEARDGNAAAA